jgi:hypothetical protein
MTERYRLAANNKRELQVSPTDYKQPYSTSCSLTTTILRSYEQQQQPK